MRELVPPIVAGFLTGAAIALWPGNTLAITIREATRNGGLRAVRAAAGRTFADLLALAAIGITVVRQPDLFTGRGTFPVAFGALAGLSLAAFGWRLMEFDTGGSLNRERGDGVIRAWHENLVLDRFLGSLGSPLWHLFWWTGGLRLGAEAAGAAGAAGVVVFGAGYVLAGIAWHAFVALRLRPPRRERALKDRQFRILTSLGGLGLVGLGFVTAVGALAESPIHRALTDVVARVFT
jgi:threonine/homoserine/homoserine lactone efflux protein